MTVDESISTSKKANDAGITGQLNVTARALAANGTGLIVPFVRQHKWLNIRQFSTLSFG